MNMSCYRRKRAKQVESESRTGPDSFVNGERLCLSYRRGRNPGWPDPGRHGQAPAWPWKTTKKHQPTRRFCDRNSLEKCGTGFQPVIGPVENRSSMAVKSLFQRFVRNCFLFNNRIQIHALLSITACIFAGCATASQGHSCAVYGERAGAPDGSASERTPASHGESLRANTDASTIQRIAFGSCCHQNKAQHIWKTVLATEPDLFIFLGDNIYADTEDMAKMKADYDKLGSVPEFQELRQTCPILATWDDHDYGKNDAGAEYPKKKEAQRVFLEFFEDSPTSPRWTREGVYGAQVFGPPGRRVQVILLDTRYHRSPLKRRAKDDPPPSDRPGPYLPNTDPDATILGEAQWEWFEAQLRIPAELRIIASSIQLAAEEHGYEKWANIPNERDRFLKLIRDTRAEGIIILSGDRHAAEVSRLDDAVGYPLYDVTSSALNMPRTHQLEANRHRVAFESLREPYFQPNFGVLTIDWSAADPLISMQIRDESGKIIVRHEITLGRLRRAS